MCQDGGANDGKAGYLSRFILGDQVHVNCAGPIFDSAGNLTGGFGCYSFLPLAK